MFIELVDSLRCLTPHEETWLVAAASRMDGRHIVDGMLGCPICRREYAIRSGTAWFTAEQPDGDGVHLTTAGTASDDAGAMRAAALLGLSEPGGIVALGGSWTTYGDVVAQLGASHVVLLNIQAGESSPQEVSSLVVDDRLPFGTGGLRGVAVDGKLASAGMLSSAAALLRSRGRLVAPADAGVPHGVEVLARDDVNWVAERTVVASPPIPLRSARR
jgi:hypothetical protein